MEDAEAFYSYKARISSFFPDYIDSKGGIPIEVINKNRDENIKAKFSIKGDRDYEEKEKVK